MEKLRELDSLEGVFFSDPSVLDPYNTKRHGPNPRDNPEMDWEKYDRFLQAESNLRLVKDDMIGCSLSKYHLGRSEAKLTPMDNWARRQRMRMVTNWNYPYRGLLPKYVTKAFEPFWDSWYEAALKNAVDHAIQKEEFEKAKKIVEKFTEKGQRREYLDRISRYFRHLGREGINLRQLDHVEGVIFELQGPRSAFNGSGRRDETFDSLCSEETSIEGLADRIKEGMRESSLGVFTFEGVTRLPPMQLKMSGITYILLSHEMNTWDSTALQNAIDHALLEEDFKRARKIIQKFGQKGKKRNLIDRVERYKRK